MMRKNKFLKKLRGKVIGLLTNGMEKGQLVILIDFDSLLLKVMNSRSEISYIPFFCLIDISEADKEEIDKFHDYQEKFKLDPTFLGDEEDNKGYTIIKRRPKYEN